MDLQGQYQLYPWLTSRQQAVVDGPRKLSGLCQEEACKYLYRSYMEQECSCGVEKESDCYDQFRPASQGTV